MKKIKNRAIKAKIINSILKKEIIINLSSINIIKYKKKEIITL